MGSPAVDTPAHIRPLPRMVGGGHAVAASANAGRAPVAASDPLMFGAGRNSADEAGPVAGARGAASLRSVPSPTAGAATAAPAVPSPAPSPTAGSSTPAASASGSSAANPAPSITSLPPATAAVPAGTPDDAADPAGQASDAGGSPSPLDGGDTATGSTGVAPGGGRGRRRASSEAVGIGLATTRSLHPASRGGGGDVRPSLSTGMLPAMGAAAMGAAMGSTAAAAHGWLPGAEQRAAGARTSLPGALSLPGRSASAMGMSDLLPSARGLAGSTESSAGNPLASAFGAAAPITPAGSAASAAPAPPSGTAAAAAGDDIEAGSPLRAARQRARGRADSAAAGASATAGAAGAAAGAATSPGAALTSLKRLTDTTSGSSPASHMPAPPPVSIRNAGAGPVPPMSAAASLARSGSESGLKRSLIDVTAGMFDSMPVGSESLSGSGGPPVPASAQSLFGGSDMAEAERRLSVVRDGDTPTAPPSPLDDPATMDNLVDEVVQRIEARVIDELERRGRRHNPGVF